MAKPINSALTPIKKWVPTCSGGVEKQRKTFIFFGYFVLHINVTTAVHNKFFSTTELTVSTSFDPIDNQSNNEHFQEVLDKALSNPSRRNVLRGGLGLASMFALPMLPGCGGTTTASNTLPALASSTLMNFTPVAKSLADQIFVPTGYTVNILLATGDTLKSGVAAYSNAGTDDAESWADRVGDQHDGT